MAEKTIWQLWADAVSSGRSYPAFMGEEKGGWQTIGWREAGRRVDEIASGFLDLGIQPGDRVGILSRTRVEWALCDFALVSIGAVVVPVYPTSSADDTAHIISHSGARAMVIEDSSHYKKLHRLREKLDRLEILVSIEEVGEECVSLGEIVERGRQRAQDRPGDLEEARGRVREVDVATIIYTSGTTGLPKGCVTTHRNHWFMTEMVDRTGAFTAGGSALLYLPLAHSFGHLLPYVGARTGLTMAFCSDFSRIMPSLQAVHPTILPTVPVLLEKAQVRIARTFDEATGARRRLISWALGVGRNVSRRRVAGEPIPPHLEAQFQLANRLVFSKVKERFGKRLQFAVSGGAPLRADVAEFFHALDIQILEGYGLTECTTVASVNRPDRFRFGTIGLALPGCEVTTAADGELLIGGENVFSGYYQDDSATREVITENGWLRTGDVGAIDDEGFITITDRKKDLIVTSGGKNIAPQHVESALKASPLVSQAFVYGDKRPYLAALLTLDEDEVKAIGAGEEEINGRLKAVVDAANRKLARFEQVRRFVVLPRDFSQDEGELTPTLKVKRRVVEEHFGEEIEQLYGERE